MKAWWLRLTRYARPEAGGLVVIGLLTLAGIGLDLLKPWPMKVIVDNALHGQPLPSGITSLTALPGAATPFGLLAWMAAATVLLFIAAQALRMLQNYVQTGVGARMLYALGAELFDHVQRLSLAFHSRHKSGDLIRRVTNDCTCVRDLILWVYLLAASSLISLVSMFAVMWSLDRLLALVALLALPPLAILIRAFAQPMAQLTYEQQQREGEMMALVEQTLTALPMVQAFSREQHEDKRFRSVSQRTVAAFLNSIASQLKFKIGTTSVTAVGTAVVMVLGGLRVLDGNLTLGGLLVILAYLSALYGPMETLAYLASGFAGAAAGARRVLEVLDADDRVRDAPGAVPLPGAPAGRGAHVCLEDVQFGYQPDRPVLRGVSLEAQPGQRVALVGPTGAGKSTLATLIPRFYDPWAGRILINGADLRSVQLDALRAGMALVLQEPFLLPLTVAENIAYGRPGASREEVIAAAVTARADAFIRRLPHGYDTLIGERGASLSGGERQRLAVARALLKDAPLLILDEPTSALDAETEFLLMEGLKRLMQGRTTLLIAHRLATIRQADRIFFQQDGRVVEDGTHAELTSRGGPYARFSAIQFGGNVL